jgi:aryl-alcohol dehydrogenase-like predicted oxidoreductase
MKYQRLGSSDLKVSEIGLGCAMTHLPNDTGVDEKKIIATVHKALDLGISFFDTSDICQTGLTEPILAQALGKQRKNLTLGTKVGLRYLNKKFTIDLSKKYIKTAVEVSLKRLKTDMIDLYQVHWPDMNNSLAGTFEALNECREEGKIRYFGVSNFDLNQLESGRKYSLIASHQIPLNLFKREYEIKLLPYCFKENIAVIAYNPLAQNSLKSRSDEQEPFATEFEGNISMFNGDALNRNRAVIESLRKFAAIRNKKIDELAMAWVLAHTAVTTTISEATSPEEISLHEKATEWILDQEELAKIELLMNVAG